MKRKSCDFQLRVAEPCPLRSHDFVGGRDFQINHRAISEAIMRPLTSRMVDLLRISASIYFLDRLIPRDRRHGPRGWIRTISYSLEVQEPDFWTASPVRELLHEALNFVSGDRWNLEFRQSDVLPGSAYACQQSIDPHFLGETRRVFLYSGGLDSATGLAKQMVESPRVMNLAVTIQHRTDLGGTVKEQLRRLAVHTGADFIPVVVPFEMGAPKSLGQAEETSQRTRSFLFVATGGIVAAAAGSSELELYESGVGAINVPLLAGMEGSQATRSAHPRFLKLMSRLLEQVVGHRLEVRLPFMAMTKGDLAKDVDKLVLQELAQSTISCAHFPVRLEKGDKWKSCGVCPACIFRRVALHAAGITEPGDVYQHDLFSVPSSPLPPKKLRYLTAYLLLVDSLRELDAGELPLLVTQHLRGTNLLQPGESPQAYLDLFRRYRSDWYGLLEQARRDGWALLNRIDVPVQAA